MDRIGLGSLVPVEYFGNKKHEFLSDRKLLQRFEVCIFGLKFVTVVFCSFAGDLNSS